MMLDDTFVLELLVAGLYGYICGTLVDVWIYIFQRIGREVGQSQDGVWR